MSRILTSHVGSLPRTQEVVDFIFARENELPYDERKFDDCMTSSVLDTVARQNDAGIDIVSDGETSKISYATYVKDRYTGFSGDSLAILLRISNCFQAFSKGFQMMVVHHSTPGPCARVR